MLKQLFLLFSLIISIFLSIQLNAQVTIGSGEPPVEGSLLDLKEFNDDLAKNGGINASKGLLLPRVALTDMNNLYPMFSAPYSLEENNKHMGLMVYNVNNDICLNLHSGVYIWDGSKWAPLGKKRDQPHVDILTDVRGDEINKYYTSWFKSTNTDAGWWMVENLRTTKWPDGSNVDLNYIPDPTIDNNEVGKFAAYTSPLMNTNLVEEYGYFYNYNAATRYSPEDPSGPVVQGICPNGWHIPSQSEWRLLLQVIKENPCTYSTSNIAANTGANLQRSGATPLGTSRPKEEGGFNAVLQGMVTHLGVIQYNNQYGNYWVSYPSTAAWGDFLGVSTFLHNNATGIGFFNISTLGGTAHYVPLRCVKDK